MPVKDSIVNAVVRKFEQRSELGQKKYGTTLDRSDLTVPDWITHAQEELMDAILYLEKLKQVSDNTTSRWTCFMLQPWSMSSTASQSSSSGCVGGVPLRPKSNTVGTIPLPKCRFHK